MINPDVAVHIADAFNTAYQSSSPEDKSDVVLASAAVHVARILADAGVCSAERFLCIAGMGGLPVS